MKNLEQLHEIKSDSLVDRVVSLIQAYAAIQNRKVTKSELEDLLRKDAYADLLEEDVSTIIAKADIMDEWEEYCFIFRSLLKKAKFFYFFYRKCLTMKNKQGIIKP